jgi:hypothetical protein
MVRRGVLGFGFVASFKWGFPSCLRGPLWLSPTTCTTRERSSPTSLTGQRSRFERLVCWQCRQARLRRAPRLRLELLPVLQQQESQPVPSCSRRPALRLDNCSQPLCQLRHKFFYGGGWVAVPCPVAFVPLVYGVRRWNFLQALGIQLLAYTILQDKYSTSLLEEFTS